MTEKTCLWRAHSSFNQSVTTCTCELCNKRTPELHYLTVVYQVQDGKVNSVSTFDFNRHDLTAYHALLNTFQMEANEQSKRDSQELSSKAHDTFKDLLSPLAVTDEPSPEPVDSPSDKLGPLRPVAQTPTRSSLTGSDIPDSIRVALKKSQSRGASPSGGVTPASTPTAGPAPAAATAPATAPTATATATATSTASTATAATAAYHNRRKSTNRDYDVSMGSPAPPPAEPPGHSRRKSGSSSMQGKPALGKTPSTPTPAPVAKTVEKDWSTPTTRERGRSQSSGWVAAKDILPMAVKDNMADVVAAATANKELLEYTPTVTGILPEPAEMLKAAMAVMNDDNRTRPQRLAGACETLRSILAHHTFVPQPEIGTGAQNAAYEHWKKRLEMIGSEGEVVLRPNTPELDELVSCLQSQLAAARDPTAVYALYGVFQMLLYQLGSEIDKSLVMMVPLLVRTLADRPYPPLIKTLIENTSRVRVLRFLFVLAKDKMWKVKMTAGQCMRLSIEQLGASALHPLCLGEILDSAQRLMTEKEEPCRATGERMMYAMAKIVEGNKELTKTLNDSIAVTMSGPRDLLTNAWKKGSAIIKQEAKLKAQQDKPAYTFEELKKGIIDDVERSSLTQVGETSTNTAEASQREDSSDKPPLSDAQRATNALDDLLTDSST